MEPSVISPDFFSSFEPKMTNRFTVKFGEPFDTIPAYVTKSATPFLLRSINGRMEWDDVVFELYDPIHPSTSQFIRDAFDKLKLQESPALNLEVKLLGPVGDIVSLWKVRGEIKTVDFGKLSWSEKTEPLTIKITFKVYNAILDY